jgi:hypothetical protein
MMVEDRYALAQRRAAEGRRIIDRQRLLIQRQKNLGQDTSGSEDLLAAFERSQEIFERDLASFRGERE